MPLRICPAEGKEEAEDSLARICGFVMGATAEQLTRRQVPVNQSGVSSDFPLEFQPPCAVTCGQRRTSAEGCDSQVTEARQGPRS